MTTETSSNIIPFPHRMGASGIFQMHINLVLMPHPVWRRILVPARMNFWELHVAIQDAMGWHDCHLHQFAVDDVDGTGRQRFGIPDDSGFHGVNDVLPGWNHAIAPFFAVDAGPALYTYDFGDEWQHEVILEEILPSEPDIVLPQCLAGEGLCPPEDSGGPAMCEALMPAPDEQHFDPESIVFDNPRLRWQNAFGRD